MDAVSVLSSMATRRLLTDMAALWNGRATLEATGGVDAAKRVRAGEVVDVVVLADGPMRELEAAGFLVPGSLEPIAVSAIAVAVRAGDPLPDLSNAEAVKRAFQAAGRVGYSTGPSGDHVLRLVADWGIGAGSGPRLVQAPPGVPVGRLLAEGTVDLAVQQLGELMDVTGITVAGLLPRAAQRETVFTAGIASTARRPTAARDYIATLLAAETSSLKRRNGFAAIAL